MRQETESEETCRLRASEQFYRAASEMKEAQEKLLQLSSIVASVPTGLSSSFSRMLCREHLLAVHNHVTEAENCIGRATPIALAQPPDEARSVDVTRGDFR